MEVFLTQLMFQIKSKSISIEDKKEAQTFSYKIGSQQIIQNQNDPVRDSDCEPFILWIKELLDDWSTKTPTSKNSWI